jgi:hypothetical protein
MVAVSGGFGLKNAEARTTRRGQQRSQLSKVYSRSHDAVIRVYDAAGNLIETHEQTGDFKELVAIYQPRRFGWLWSWTNEPEQGAPRRFVFPVTITTTQSAGAKAYKA